MPEGRGTRNDSKPRTYGHPVELPEFSARFSQLLHDRVVIDTYQKEKRQFAPGALPHPVRAVATRHQPRPLTRVVRASLGEPVSSHRARNTNSVLPASSFRAPILGAANQTDRPGAKVNPNTTEREAARIIEERLARDGLLPTLAKTVAHLGAARCLANPGDTLVELHSLGLPVDLLQHFQAGGATTASDRPRAILEQIARALQKGGTIEEIQSGLKSTRFSFSPAQFKSGAEATAPAIVVVTTDLKSAEFDLEAPGDSFEAAVESGEHRLGMFRLQVGGGWRDGIVPGGSIDLISQLAHAHRDVDFLISVIDELAAPFESMITNSWPLRRRNQVTLAVETSPVGAWAQDNGKAGVVRVAGGSPRLATLAPRYASQGEGGSRFEPGESYLMDGLSAAGHAVLHSSLLFQGGNLLVVRLPQTKERILVLGEGEVYRNTALGLDYAQVVEAFRREFGVERCVVLPAVSYHLDFDVSFRVHEGELIAFVNDNPSAARQVVGLGITALERHGALDATSAAVARNGLALGREREALRVLGETLRRVAPANAQFPTALSGRFVADSTDDAVGNLQTFLLAMDVLESGLPAEAGPAAGDSPRAAYLEALRRMSHAQARQAAELKKIGCRIVPLPSMADLHRGINYLNGIQHRDGYIMPAFGGFYASLDREAQAAFRRTLGDAFKITFIRSAECQRMHGGVHCAAAAYPALAIDQ